MHQDHDHSQGDEHALSDDHETQPEQVDAVGERSEEPLLQTLPRYALSMLSWFFERQAGVQDDADPEASPHAMSAAPNTAARLLKQDERTALHKIIVWLHHIDAIEAPTALQLPGSSLQLVASQGLLLITPALRDALPALASWHSTLERDPICALSAQLATLLLHVAKRQEQSSWHLAERALATVPAHTQTLCALDLLRVGRYGLKPPDCHIAAFHLAMREHSLSAWLWRSSNTSFTDMLLDAVPRPQRLPSLYSSIHVAHTCAHISPRFDGRPLLSVCVGSDCLWVVARDSHCVSLSRLSPTKMGLAFHTFDRLCTDTPTIRQYKLT
jgi:hypothetical protein